MARNPYAPRRDYNRIGLFIVAGLAVALTAVLAFALLQPPRSHAQERASAQLITQMDIADRAYEAKRAAAESKRRRAL